MKPLNLAFGISALFVFLSSTLHAEPRYVTFSADGGELQPTSINNKGAVTGYVGHFGSAGTTGFLRQPDGTMVYFSADPSEGAIAPTSINDKGDITGTYDTATARKKGFLRKADGTVKTFTLAHDSGGDYPTVINSHGKIFGVVWEHSNITGFVREKNGSVTEFRCPSGMNYVSGANDLGVSVGWGGKSGFVRTADGVCTPFSAGDYTSPMGINDQGWVAGYADYNSGISSGFLRAPDGTVTLFNAPGDTGFTRAVAIGGRGRVVGYYYDKVGARGFVRNAKGRLVTIAPPGSATNAATSINDKGVVTGWYNDQSQHNFGFIRYP